MAACAKANVAISFLTPYGGFLAAVTGFTPGNVVLRREQYRRADQEEATLAISKEFVSAKIANSRSVLLRAASEIRKILRYNLNYRLSRLVWPTISSR
jgi:CRISPR-associated protein Cas1